MKVEFYSIPGCTYCKKLKLLLQRAKLDYIETIVGKDLSREDYIAMYPNKQSFPFVIIDGEEIGGVVDTAKFLFERGLVSKRSNERN